MKRVIAVLALTVVIFLSTTGLALASGYQVSSDGYFGCLSKDYYSKIVRYAVQEDVQAFEKALLGGYATGECIRLQADERVFVEETAVFSGLVKIRKPGDTLEFWAAIEAIKEVPE